jgi:hypothetical protein
VLLVPEASALLLSASSDSSSLPFWAGVGTLAGVFLFVQGFRMLRFERLVLNTPYSKVRSASMGLVEVSGVANGPSTIPAGITGESCFYYRAVASELKRSGNRREWRTVADERLFVPFFVEDPTGGMLVNPQGADLDLHCNFKDELSSSFFGSRDMAPENVAKFLARYGILASENVRLEEWCIKPTDPLFVLGTLGKRTVNVEWSALPHSPGTRLSFSFGGGSFGQVENKLVNSINFVPGINIQFSVNKGPLGASPGAQSLPEAPAPVPAAAPAVWQSVSWEEDLQAHAIPAAPAAPAGAPAAAALPADATGASAQDDLQSAAASQTAVSLETNTPTDAPADAPQNSQFDTASPVEIGKGAEGQPFFISYRSQREVARSFAWKSALCIWGGPILTLASLYFLSVYFNWM